MFPSVPDVFGIGCPVSRIVLNVSADGVEAFFVSGGMFVIVTLPDRGARSVAGFARCVWRQIRKNQRQYRLSPESVCPYMGFDNRGSMHIARHDDERLGFGMRIILRNPAPDAPDNSAPNYLGPSGRCQPPQTNVRARRCEGLPNTRPPVHSYMRLNNLVFSSAFATHLFDSTRLGLAKEFVAVVVP